MVRRLPQGKGNYKGKIPLKYLNYRKIRHISKKCPDNDRKEKNMKWKHYKDKGKKNFYLLRVSNNESTCLDGDKEIAFNV